MFHAQTVTIILFIFFFFAILIDYSFLLSFFSSNVYDTNQIDVGATFLSSSGTRLWIPCFPFQQYTQSSSNSWSPSGSRHWYFLLLFSSPPSPLLPPLPSCFSFPPLPLFRSLLMFFSYFLVSCRLCRFAPTQTGSWTYTISAKDSSSTATSTGSFTAVSSSQVITSLSLSSLY